MRWIIVPMLMVVQTLLLPIKVHGQEVQKDTAAERYKNSILPSPTVSYAPETDVVVGLWVMYQFKPKTAGPETRPSNAQFYIGSSFNDQVIGTIEYDWIFPQEKFYIKGKWDYRLFPEAYYGVGPETMESDLITTSYKLFTFDHKFYKKFNQKYLIGPAVQVLSMSDLEYFDSAGDSTGAPDISGNEGGTNVGLGGSFLIDRRNSILTPTGDYYLESTLMGFWGDQSYGLVSFDGRKYWDLRKDTRHVFAVQAKVQFTWGDIPFREYAKIGGAQIMRGYLLGRYRDRHSLQFQGEYRLHLFWRLGATAFGGIGNVYPNVGDLLVRETKYTYGLGLRFNANQNDPANVRIDWGFGEGTSGVYITFGEAF